MDSSSPPSFSGASTDNLPPGVLYKVKASYKYQAEDVDELNFEVGEIVHVVPYEDPEEQVRAEKKCDLRARGRRGVHETFFIVHETLPAPFRSKQLNNVACSKLNFQQLCRRRVG